MTDNKHATVGIVGGGITGLALTHYLAEEGIDSVAFEAASEPGGVISTRHVDGKILEAGPQRMRKTAGVSELARTAGIEDDIREAREEQLYVYAGGELGRAPLSIPEFLETDLLSWPGKLRMLAEPLTRTGMEQETARDLFVRKFGQEAYDRFIGPLYGGIYGSDPAEMPAAYALEGLIEREKEAGSFLQAFRQRVSKGHDSPPISFANGNQQLPNALADQYSDRIELETPVESIECVDDDQSTATAAGDTAQTARWRVTTPAGDWDVTELIVTTPADVTADLLSGIADGAEKLRDLRYNPLALVFLDADHNRTGKGYQVAFDDSLTTLGVSWNSQMFDRDGVQTVFLGGMHDPELVTESDETVGTIACEEFEQVMDTDASVIDVARLDPGFPAWDSSWWSLEALDLPPGLRLATNYTARMGIPSRIREARRIATELASDDLDKHAPATRHAEQEIETATVADSDD